MSQAFFKLIQTGATAEIADAVENDPSLARAHDASGVSALLWSVYTGQPLVRDFLLAELARQHADLDIFEASATGSTARLAKLVQSNPQADPQSVNTHSTDGWTPLHLAAAFATPEAVNLLLTHGAMVDSVSKNPQANQPLHAALALSRNPETVRLLLTAGANPNAVQAGGFTPIFSAATANRRDLAELLISHGAKVQIRSHQDKTPADFARERGHQDLAAWLEQQA
jgi:ankyrin repeat protein